MHIILGICHYDQIVDEKKDTNEIIKAKKYFNLLIIIIQILIMPKCKI